MTTLLEVALLTISPETIHPATAEPSLQPRTTAPRKVAPEGAELLAAIIESLEDSKAEEIVSIDIAGRSSLADVMVIASGRSHRHVGAIADHLDKRLRELGIGQLRVEGLPHCDWVLVDAGDAMIHLFRPEVRSFYNLEKMWESDPTPPPKPTRAAPRG